MDLRMYYAKFMPIKEIAHLLSLAMPERFEFREFSFGFPHEGSEIYVRWLSFDDVYRLEEAIRRRNPARIDIGPFYGTEPRLKHTGAEMFPIRREFVIDIDVDDYENLRSCSCGSQSSSAKVCEVCWPFIAIAVEVIDHILRKKFGLSDLLWFFSGRRGVHCWSLDSDAALFTDSYRTAICDYLYPWTAKKAWSTTTQSLEFKPEALAEFHTIFKSMLLPHFERMVNAGTLNMNDSYIRGFILTACKPKQNAALGHALIPALVGKSGAHVWAAVKNAIVTHHASGATLIQTLVMAMLFPRLDYNVSKKRQHLLRCPLSVNTKTGNVCVPIVVQQVHEFKPSHIPNIKSGEHFEAMTDFVQILQTFLLRDTEIAKRLVCMHCADRRQSLANLSNRILFVDDQDWEEHKRLQHPKSSYTLANSRLGNLIAEMTTNANLEQDQAYVRTLYWQLEEKFGQLD